MDYLELLPWAAPAQANYLRTIIRVGSIKKAVEELGVNRRTVERAVKAVRRKAAAAGHSPYEESLGRAAEGYHVKGKSTFYDEDGNIKAQWVKTNIDKDTQIQLLKDSFTEFAEDYTGIIKKTPPPKNVSDDLMLVIPMGDPHVGLYCWHENTGADFDIKIARQIMSEAVTRLVKTAPRCKEGLLISLGDFFHADLMDQRTWRSGHNLDADTRYSYVLRVGVSVMKLAIQQLLKKCEKVKVITALGNHDDHSSQFLALVLSEAYANEPRVKIDVSPMPFHYHRFGKNLIGVTHGHTVKPDQLPGIMAHDQSEGWGKTEFRQWFVGHFHSRKVWEFPGCTVSYERTLAAKDKWTTEHGYRSLREMRAVVFHKDYGEFESYRVGVEQLG
jgi:hypothetical protein